MRKNLLIIFLFIRSIYLWGQVPVGASIPGVLPQDRFGYAVAVNGDGTRMVASSFGGFLVNNTPSVRVFDLVQGSWTQVGSDITGISSTGFGNSVDISDDGLRLVIGVPYTVIPFNGTGGDVMVLEWDGMNWALMTYLPTTGSVGAFGWDVAISGDGERIVVGNPETAGARGRVRIFEWTGTTWSEMGTSLMGVAVGEALGSSVAISEDGSRIIAGADANVFNVSLPGYAKAFEWDGNQWVQMGLTLSGSPFIDKVGYDVAMNDAGDRVAISSPNYNPNNLPTNAATGGIQILAWNGSGWDQVGNTVESFVTQGQDGPRIALSGSGDRLAIGCEAAFNQLGAAAIYELNANTNQWEQVGSTILGSSLWRHTGFAVDLSKAGDIVVIGSPEGGTLPNGQAANNGFVRVFDAAPIQKLLKTVVKIDLDNDCLPDSQELGIANIPVMIHDGIQTITSVTDLAGSIIRLLDTGTYQVSLDLSLHPYFASCALAQQLSIDSTSSDTTVIEFVLQQTLDCPYMTAELSAPFIRRCFPGQYFINYCNNGSDTAHNAYVELILDANLSFTSSSLPIASQNGNQLTFDLGNVAPGTCEIFTVSFTENCQSILGQIHCSSIHIYPDSICAGGLPRIEIEEECVGDTLKYLISDVNQNTPTLNYLVVTGASIADSGFFDFFSNPHDSLAFPTASYSQPYQLIIAPGDPDYYQATGLFSCQTQGTDDLIFAPASPHHFEDTDCQANVGSYDPNDKQATPVGSGPVHEIDPGTTLEFLLRFQNTGTDTAFFVNILDTLPEQVVPSSIQVRAASHPYTLTFQDSVVNGRTLCQFTFDPILLPDSATDQIGSQGFIKFSLEMKDSLPLGTQIQNTASIYFDFNAPIQTNTTLQTLFAPGPRCDGNETVIQVNACPGYTWIDGNTYFSDNNSATYTYTDSTGCDSTFRLDYTVLSLDTSVFVVRACPGYTWLDGNTYFEDNDTATITYTTAGGCDSTIRLNYQVKIIDTVVDNVTACPGYTWIDGNTYYEENDIATVTYITPEGCDLTYRLDFTPIIVDTSVIVSGQSFVSPALNATFQWIDCQTNLPIPGANQNFYPPTISGQYAVIIQQNGCQDTSVCLPFERTPSSIDPQTEIQIYPNPSVGEVILDLGKSYSHVNIELWDVLGKKVWGTEETALKVKRIQLPEAKGLYVLRVQAEGLGEISRKIMRE
ncbi:MAG: T9SS type A sorting domain-containing protein [Bacteroidota bacterium]